MASITFNRVIRVGGQLTDVDVSTTPTIDIVRTDTQAVVTAAATMSRQSLGRYYYTLSDPVAATVYRATYTLTVNGNQISSSSDQTLSGATTAQQMVDLIKNALASSPAAVLTVIVDGQTVTYSRAQAIEELKFWQREAGREAGMRPRVSSIRLDGW